MADWEKRKEYWDGVNTTAADIVERADDEEDLTDLVSEAVDSDEWVIYTAGNIGVLRFSDADLELPLEEFGAEFLETDSVSLLLQKLAYVYLEHDVREKVSTLWEEKVKEEDDE